MTAQTHPISCTSMRGNTLPTRAPLNGPRPITDAGRWGRRADELAEAGLAIVAEAATNGLMGTTFEPADVDPSWQLLLRTSNALGLLLDLDAGTRLRRAG